MARMTLSEAHRKGIKRRLKAGRFSVAEVARTAHMRIPTLYDYLAGKTDNPTCGWLDRVYGGLTKLERSQR